MPILLAIPLRAAGDGSPAGAALPGLDLELTDGARTVHTTSPAPHFYLKAGESLHPAVATNFRARWQGQVSILEGGRYTFLGGEAEVFVDGEKVTGKPILLASGRHPIRIDYRRESGAARLELAWRSEFFPREPLPVHLLSRARTADRDSAGTAAERGRGFFEEFGCIHCHVSRSPDPEGRRGPDLSQVGARVRPRWIYHWLLEPRALRPGAVMPALLDAGECRDVTAYLSTLGARREEAPPVSFTPHEIGKGRELYRSIGCAACHDQEDLSLEGAGSKWLAPSLVNYLLDPERVSPEGRMPSMLLSTAEARALAAHLLRSRSAGLEEAFPGEGDGDAVRGRELVRTRGCLACHDLRDPEALTGAPGAPRLEALADSGGCLAEQPPAGLPRYGLTREERRELRAFLRFHRDAPDLHPAPWHAARRRLRQLRCTACHELDGRDPVIPPAERVPSLTGAGARLRTDWIRQVLEARRRMRPWLDLRMPHYAAPRVRGLPEALAALSGRIPAGGAGPAGEDLVRAGGASSMDALRADGVKLLGSDTENGGLSCVTCHDFRDHRPVADEKGPQIIGTAERLRFEWFRRWMLDPGRILSGTSMPQYFTEDRRDEGERATARLWAALLLGDEIPEPDGVGASIAATGSEVIPLAGHEAVIQRFPMSGATAAAIAVGLPRQGKVPEVSLCFDAAECRVVYAWQGGFIDLSRSMGKRMDHPGILGETFYRPGAFPLRTLRVDRIPARRFRGYRIVEGYPEFHYTVDGVDVRVRIVPARPGSGFVQEFTIARVEGPAWFVVESGEGVRLSSTVGEFRDGELRLPTGERVRFDVRVMREGK